MKSTSYIWFHRSANSRWRARRRVQSEPGDQPLVCTTRHPHRVCRQHCCDSFHLQDMEQADFCPDIILSGSSGSPRELTHDLSLKFTSIVDVSRVPLCLASGAPYEVTTTSPDSQDWFSSIVTHNHGCDDDSSWWQDAKANSPLGVLVSVTSSKQHVVQQSPRITEILFYASRKESVLQRPPTPPSSPEDFRSKRTEPVLKLHAQALSSDFYSRVTGSTPPSPPGAKDESSDGVFLPFSRLDAAEVINEPPVRKRKSAADRFAEQTERSKVARREAAKTVSARHSEPRIPTLKHSRSVSGVSNFSHSKSRSPSISRPSSVRGVSEAQKRSSLSHVQAVPSATSAESVEARNKELISRMVMAGMRFHGLAQSKSLQSRPDSPATETAIEERETARKNDEEYKAIYHQVYKGACFAFRKHASSTPLQPYVDILRENVDKLLGLFCTDPLAQGLPGSSDEVTPGGRKAFGASTDKRNVEHQSPFQQTVME
nr:hypothetical protein CFP56_71270 [Quercus suber]